MPIMKKEIKAVIFDVGGVLDKGGWKKHYLPMCKELKIDSSEFSDSQKKHIKKARVGKISTRRYIILIAKDIKINSRALLKSWIKWKRKSLVKNKELERIIMKLKKSYIVGALTNVIALHHKLRIEKGFYSLFDFRLCSHEQKLCKPQLKFYKLILKKINFKPQEVIFVDDYAPNLLPAKKLRMKTILFKNNSQLVKDLRKLSVKV